MATPGSILTGEDILGYKDDDEDSENEEGPSFAEHQMRWQTEQAQLAGAQMCLNLKLQILQMSALVTLGLVHAVDSFLITDSIYHGWRTAPCGALGLSLASLYAYSKNGKVCIYCTIKHFILFFSLIFHLQPPRRNSSK